jgi:transcriptional regulator with PAS, ATPase and Fis domain
VRRLGSGQEIPLDVRVLAATNQNPVTAVEQGRLRRDLYFRLNVFTVTLPALRDRRDDIPALVQHFIAKANEKHGAAVQAVRPEVWERLKEYSWPGNVRELKNALERAVIVAQGDWIELSHLPPYLRHAAPPAEEAIVLPAGVTAAETEKQLILKTLEQTGHNKAAAARRLGLDVKTIRNKLKAYGIH